MCHERVDHVAAVEHQQHDRGPEGQELVADSHIVAGWSLMQHVVRYGGQHERDQNEDKEARQEACALALEDLSLAREAADHHGEPEPEQARADDGTGNLRSDDICAAIDQDEDRENEFGDRAETDVQKAADRRSRLGRDVLGGRADPMSQHDDADRARGENPQGWRRDRKAEDGRNRNEEQQEQRDHQESS